MKHMKMGPTVIQTGLLLGWADLLDSYTFVQGRERMCGIAADGTRTHCCLAVAAEGMGVPSKVVELRILTPGIDLELEYQFPPDQPNRNVVSRQWSVEQFGLDIDDIPILLNESKRSQYDIVYLSADTMASLNDTLQWTYAQIADLIREFVVEVWLGQIHGYVSEVNRYLKPLRAA